MGLFKDLAKLQKMGNQQLASMDVKGQLADAQSRMNAILANQPSPAALPDGLAITAQATVVSTRDTGVIVNGASVIEVELMVLLPTGVPVQVTRSVTALPLHLYRLQPGRRVDVRLDPADPQNTLQLTL
ncbi:hypothetical protein ATK74_0617 [Propionicimonas paludicola]|uniref:Uncharacterized protein n=2 Tax=Propionicimonas paludicola TaxID=185243 RepID=A0A2A9CNQ2_9ACTN|nr:hypothetical protein ATK74_0617 [Propionicimonas paludicola]